MKPLGFIVPAQPIGAKSRSVASGMLKPGGLRTRRRRARFDLVA
jgi:hypothetical protein